MNFNFIQHRSEIRTWASVLNKKQIAPREKKMASLLYPSNNEILTRYFQLVRAKKEMNWYQAYHYLPHSLVAFKSLMRGMPCANA